MRALPALLVGLLLAPACNKTSEPPPSGDTARPASTSGPATGHASSAAPRPAGPTDVAYDVPSTWTKAEKTPPMRKASYVVPRAAGDAEDGELGVSQAGGAVVANIARWANQLDRGLPDVKRAERTVNGLRVTVVEIHGEYMGMGMPGAAAPEKKPGSALLGAIVETSPLTFFKLTGPEKTVMAARPDFDKMVDGLRAK